MGQIQRELERLVDSGVLQSTKRGRQVYFRANSNCPIFEELRGIVTKTIGAVAVLREALHPLCDRIAVAFIFGSVARSDERENSDLDVMIVGDVTFGEIVKVIRTAEDTLEREINPSIFPPDELRNKLAAANHFLKTIMTAEKVFVLGDEHELAALLQQPVDS